jgi:hypothetical protein
MRVLTALVHAGLIGACVYCAIRCVQDLREHSRFWRELRAWIKGMQRRSVWKS